MGVVLTKGTRGSGSSEMGRKIAPDYECRKERRNMVVTVWRYGMGVERLVRLQS